jgi:hypothetical protein
MQLTIAAPTNTLCDCDQRWRTEQTESADAQHQHDDLWGKDASEFERQVTSRC